MELALARLGNRGIEMRIVIGITIIINRLVGKLLQFSPHGSSFRGAKSSAG